MNGVWQIKSDYNYNTIWHSMQLNLLLATGAQWSDTIRRSITTEIDNIRFLFTYIYFFIFIMASNMILLNTFAGITLKNVKAIKEEKSSTNSLPPDEFEWAEVQKLFLHKKLVRKYAPPPEAYKAFFLGLSESTWYEHVFINIYILIAIIAKACTHVDQPAYVQNINDFMNIAMLVLFNSEIFITSLGKGWHAYSIDEFKMYDLITVLLYDAAFVLSKVKDSWGDILVVPLVIRILRASKIMKHVATKNKLLST